MFNLETPIGVSVKLYLGVGVGSGLVSDITNVQKISKIKKKFPKKNYLLIKVMYLNKYTSVVKLRYLKNSSYRVNKEKELLVFL